MKKPKLTVRLGSARQLREKKQRRKERKKKEKKKKRERKKKEEIGVAAKALFARCRSQVRDPETWCIDLSTPLLYFSPTISSMVCLHLLARRSFNSCFFFHSLWEFVMYWICLNLQKCEST